MTSENSIAEPPRIDQARVAITEFLQRSLAEARMISVTRLSQVDAEMGAWEAEVEVWQPNPTIRMLGLETERPVLDRNEYLVRLDGQLNVVAYGEKESADNRMGHI